MKKYLIIGLGNIGGEYHETRHNVGFMILDALAQRFEIPFAVDRLASTATIRHKGRHLLLIKPSTYMNLSGKAVRYWMEKENIPIENILVLFDDIDLDVGAIRIKPKGGGGTHNGINDIIDVLNSQNFARLRFGIGKNYSQGHQVDYVLSLFNNEEYPFVVSRLKTAGDAILSFVTAGIGLTMTTYNQKNTEGDSSLKNI